MTKSQYKLSGFLPIKPIKSYATEKVWLIMGRLWVIDYENFYILLILK